MHQSKLINDWKVFPINVFKCIQYLRRRGKLFHAKEPKNERLIFILAQAKVVYIHEHEDVQKESDLQVLWSFTENNLLH